MAEYSHDYGMTVGKSAEHQMRKWALELEIRERVEHEKAVEKLPEYVYPFLAISRDTGAGASEVADAVGKRLGWDVLNRELLHYMAEKYHLQPAMLEFVDEHTTSWLIDVFAKWLDGRFVSESEYVKHLGELVLLAAHHGSTVYVGRGAQFFLPRERGVAVQIIAPAKQRIERIMQRRQISREEARKYLEKTDHDRQEFVQRHFHHDANDPHLYDLVLNMHYLSIDDAAELIVNQIQRRFGKELKSK